MWRKKGAAPPPGKYPWWFKYVYICIYSFVFLEYPIVRPMFCVKPLLENNEKRVFLQFLWINTTVNSVDADYWTADFHF